MLQVPITCVPKCWPLVLGLRRLEGSRQSKGRRWGSCLPCCKGPLACFSVPFRRLFQHSTCCHGHLHWHTALPGCLPDTAEGMAELSPWRDATRGGTPSQRCQLLHAVSCCQYPHGHLLGGRSPCGQGQGPHSPAGEGWWSTKHRPSSRVGLEETVMVLSALISLNGPYQLHRGLYPHPAHGPMSSISY